MYKTTTTIGQSFLSIKTGEPPIAAASPAFPLSQSLFPLAAAHMGTAML